MLGCLIVALLNVENESKIFFWVFDFGCIHKVHLKRACTVVYGRYKKGTPHLPSTTKHRFKEVQFIGLCQHHKILYYRTILNKKRGDMPGTKVLGEVMWYPWRRRRYQRRRQATLQFLPEINIYRTHGPTIIKLGRKVSTNQQMNPITIIIWWKRYFCKKSTFLQFYNRS